MSRKWQAGDVAMVTYDLYEDGESVVTEPRILRSDKKWYGSNGWVLNDSTLTIRPLVVIDPEDRAAVERLVDGWFAQATAHPGTTQRMQTALREFANPTLPKRVWTDGDVVQHWDGNYTAQRNDDGWRTTEQATDGYWADDHYVTSCVESGSLIVLREQAAEVVR